MGIGGQIIEIRRMTLVDPDNQRARIDVIRLWTVDKQGDEVCVYVEPADQMPLIREEIWWQAGKVYFGRDMRVLKKIGCSFSAPVAA
jgi:hypothetical protein